MGQRSRLESGPVALISLRRQYRAATVCGVRGQACLRLAGCLAMSTGLGINEPHRWLTSGAAAVQMTTLLPTFTTVPVKFGNICKDCLAVTDACVQNLADWERSHCWYADCIT
jgi:hypothetical protein